MRKICLPLLLILFIIVFATVQQRLGWSQATIREQTTKSDNAAINNKLRNPYHLFKGIIDDRYDFQAYLRLDGQKLSGSYFFTRPTAFTIKRFDLKGNIDSAGNVTLDEVIHNWDEGKENLVRAFEGKATSNLETEQFPIRITGTWFNHSDKKLFALEEQTLSIGNGKYLTIDRVAKDYKRLNYTINVAYPQIVGFTDARITKFNELSKILVFKRIDEFKSAFAAAAKYSDPLPISPETGKPIDKTRDSLDISCSALTLNENYISIKLDEDASGGAHGMQSTYVINYDLVKGKSLQLSNLFKPKSPYLQTISRACIGALKQSNATWYVDGGVETLRQGASPKNANYEAWNLTPYGLLVTFVPYQVAPYGAGVSEVVIPYDILKSIIQPSILQSLSR